MDTFIFVDNNAHHIVIQTTSLEEAEKIFKDTNTDEHINKKEINILLAKNNQVKFLKTTFLSEFILRHIWRLFNYLEYDFINTTQVYKYINNNTLLNPDQSTAVKYALGLISETEMFPPIPNDIILTHQENAKQHFGTTICFAEAGYLLPTGEMIDFSKGMPFRILDHRSIHEIFTEDFDNPNQAMINFMNHGNIRIISGGFDTSTKLTSKQMETLKAFLQFQTHIYVDISNQEGQKVWSKQYEYETPDTIFEDVNTYFSQLKKEFYNDKRILE